MIPRFREAFFCCKGSQQADVLAHRRARPAAPPYGLDLHPEAPPKQARVAPWKIPLTGGPGTVDDPDDGHVEHPGTRGSPYSACASEFRTNVLPFCTATNAAYAEPNDYEDGVGVSSDVGDGDGDGDEPVTWRIRVCGGLRGM